MPRAVACRLRNTFSALRTDGKVIYNPTAECKTLFRMGVEVEKDLRCTELLNCGVTENKTILDGAALPPMKAPIIT